jgi:tetraacyldisaccharide 4'-kinase
VPVISIGNLTMGGTGKTPCVEYVARRCRDWGLRAVLLSRGYKSTRGRNDEALLLEQNLPDVPHLQGSDRAALASRAVREHHANVLVLDDGFQHRRLARDLDIVLVDATEPWGYGHLCPRGFLREEPDGLARADFVLLTRVDQVSAAARRGLSAEIRRLAPRSGIAETTHRPLDLIDATGSSTSLEPLVGRPVAAFCGIGNPGAFRKALLDRGIQLVDFRSYPDHHGYPPPDRAELAGWLGRQPADCLALTTQKDLVKLACLQLGGRDLRALRIGLHFESNEEQFNDSLATTLSLKPHSNHVKK